MPRCKPPSAAPNGSSTTRRAAWYGARRVFAYALMIYDGIPAESSTSTCAPAPVHRAAQLLRLSQDDLASELVRSKTSSSAIVVTDARSALPHGTPPWTSESSTSLIKGLDVTTLR